MTEILEFALETARRAGRLLCEFANQQHTINHKSTVIDLVTEADLASEKLIVAAIRTRFPNHTIQSEEGLGDLGTVVQGCQKQAAHETPYLWLVDPLDGTVNYAHSYPMWGVSLALAEAGKTTIGVVYDPLRDEIFWAERGQGSRLNGARLQVSKAARLQESLLATGFPYRAAFLADNNLAEFNAMVPRAQGVRRAGAAVLDLAHVAAGRLDGYWEKHLQPWDWAAGWLLVEEAGGTVTTMDGRPWSLQENNMAASNSLIHDELLNVFRHTMVGKE
ncbi:MAG: inositol monophosphatase [Anaerolineae bacterium]|nr:inositol monophosphatase [Anaerolineae bacterium]